MAEEAGELYVRLAADIDDLKKGINSAMSELGSFAKKAEDFQTRSNSAWQSFGNSIEKSKFAFAAVGAAVGAMGISVLREFGNQETAVVALTGALASQGITSREVVSDLEAYATALQNQTIFSDSAILSAQAMLVNYGVTGDELKDLTAVTLDFAAATGKDLNAAMATVGSAMAGRAMELKRYGIEITASMSQTEKMTALMEGFARWEGRAAMEAQTLWGMLKSLGNSISDVQKTLGSLIQAEAKMVLDILQRVTKAVLAFIETNPGIAKLGLAFVGLAGAVAMLFAGLGLFLTFAKGPVLAVVAVLSSKVVAVAALIAGVGLAVAALITNFMGLRESIANIVLALLTLTNPLILIFETLFPNLIRNTVGAIWNFVSSIFQAGETGSSFISRLLSSVWAVISGVFNRIISVAGFLIPQSVKDAVSAIGGTVSGAFETIGTEIGNVKNAFVGALGEARINFNTVSDDLKKVSIETSDTLVATHDKAAEQMITKDMMRAEMEKARLRASAEEHSKLYELLGIEQENWSNQARALSSSFFNQWGRGFADMIQQGRSFSSVMKSIWQDLSRQIIEMIGRMIAKWLIWQAMTGGAGSVMPGGGGLFGGFARGGVIGEPSIITGLRSGRQVIAGESGPEAVVPYEKLAERDRAMIDGSSGGNGAGGGGGSTTINVTISGQFLESDESKWQMLIRDKVVPEIERFAMTRPIGPFTRRRGATA